MFPSEPPEPHLYHAMVAVLVILLVSAVVFRSPPTHMNVPRRIWTYLPSSRLQQLTPHEKNVLYQWVSYHPNYTITILTEKNYHRYVRLPRVLVEHPVFFPDHAAALLALYTLVEHGGVWLDSNKILKEPLERWLFPRPAGFACSASLAYSEQDVKPPVIDMELLAGKPNHPWLTQWRDEFSRAVEFPSIEHYVSSRALTTDLSMFANPLDRPACVAAQALLQQTSPTVWREWCIHSDSNNMQKPLQESFEWWQHL